mgnify:CR=1 FL=1
MRLDVVSIFPDYLAALDLSLPGKARATGLLGTDATEWSRTVTDNPAAMQLRADDVPLDTVAELAGEVVATVSEKRATWLCARKFAICAT